MTPAPDHKGNTLLWLARNAVEASFARVPVVVPEEPWLRAPGASFVTLHQSGELRGCVGSIEAHRPLGVDVVSTARSAAFDDLRFEPLVEDELALLHFEVSVLSPLSPFLVRDEDDALSRLVPERDGVLLAWGPFRGVFLPKVWEQVPDPREFLAHLKTKAGLPPDFWSSGMTLQTFTTEVFSERERAPVQDDAS